MVAAEEVLLNGTSAQILYCEMHTKFDLRERQTWRCSHCMIWGTGVWAARDGPSGPRVRHPHRLLPRVLLIFVVSMQQLRPHLRAGSQIAALGKRPSPAGSGGRGTMTLTDLCVRCVAFCERLPFRPGLISLCCLGSQRLDRSSGVSRGWQVMCVLYVSSSGRPAMTRRYLQLMNLLTHTQ